MFLNAYYKLIAYSQMCVAATYASSYGTTAMSIPQLMACNGTILNKLSISINNYNRYVGDSPFSAPYKGMFSQNSNWTSSQTTSYPFANIIIGSGTTPPQATDYQIENELYTNISFIALTCDIDTTNGSIRYEKTMKNNSDTEITISEMGLTWPVSNTYNSYTGYQILVYREVLDTPLAVQPGETFTVSITHQFTMPT